MSFNLVSWIESTPGQIVTVLLIVLLFGSILISGKKEKNNSENTRTMTICAVLIALSVVLGMFKLFEMPQGGTVTPLSLLPIVLAGYFYGVRRGVMVGMCVGLINLIIGGYVIHPVQMILDYPLAFGAIALGAVFRNSKKFNLTLTYISGIFFRYIIAVISGIIFFGSYAPEGFNSFTWSIWYNFTYLGVEAALTIAVISIPTVKTTINKLKVNS